MDDELPIESWQDDDTNQAVMLHRCEGLPPNWLWLRYCLLERDTNRDLYCEQAILIDLEDARALRDILDLAIARGEEEK